MASPSLSNGLMACFGCHLVKKAWHVQHQQSKRSHVETIWLDLRQVWTELSELLLFLLPLLNVTQLRSRVTAFLPRATAASPNGPILGLRFSLLHFCYKSCTFITSWHSSRWSIDYFCFQIYSIIVTINY